MVAPARPPVRIGHALVLPMLVILAASSCQREPTRLLSPTRLFREFTQDGYCTAGRIGQGCSITISNIDPIANNPEENPPVHQIYIGPEQTGPVTVTFSSPISGVYVTGRGSLGCFANIGTVTAYDVTGAPILSHPFHLEAAQDCESDQVTFGEADTLLTSTPIAKIIIYPMFPISWQQCYMLGGGPGEPPPYEHCDDYHSQQIYSVFWREDGAPPPPPNSTIEITKAQGPNPGGSFITKRGERKIDLAALVNPTNLGPFVKWDVEDFPGDQVQTPIPASADVKDGTPSSFLAPMPDASRWRAIGHKGSLDQKSLAYEIFASVNANGTPVRSTSKIVRQDEIDTMREEYVELGISQGVPSRGSIRAVPLNNGDYTVGVFNAQFDALLNQLKANWAPKKFDLNGYFRNPVHNAYHVNGGGSGTISASWHQYGCGADIQTQPPPPYTAKQLRDAQSFWENLMKEAVKLGFRVEPRDRDPAHPTHPYSGVGHVHVELRCPQ
jgi:hypothetical protein